MYTTIDNVREFSGFDDATKISGTVIRNKISMADSKVDASIIYRYVLPMAYRRQNRLTFSGTGTDSGNLTVTINGTGYVVAVTSGMTASQAADAFRVAAKDSADFQTEGFITDDTSGDAEITIISLTDSSDLTTADLEVNITDAGGTVQGIAGAAGIRSDRYVPLIEQLSTEIATALIFMDNYGIEAQDTPKDGEKKLELLDKMLAQLQGTSEDGVVLRLVDEVTKLELEQSAQGLPKYHGTDVTSDPDYSGDDATPSLVKMGDKF